MSKDDQSWKQRRTEFCAHFVNKKDTDMHMLIVPSSANLDCYHVIIEFKDDDSNMEFNYMCGNEIEKNYGILL